jgi:fatty acid desaturase
VWRPAASAFFYSNHSLAKEMRPAYEQLLKQYRKNERSVVMLWTLALILVVLWLLGVVTSYTAGGLIHILLVVALVVIVIRLLQGRRPLV